MPRICPGFSGVRQLELKLRFIHAIR